MSSESCQSLALLLLSTSLFSVRIPMQFCLRINLRLAITLATRDTMGHMYDFRFRCYGAAVRYLLPLDLRPPLFSLFSQSMFSSHNSTAMLNAMSGACGTFSDETSVFTKAISSACGRHTVLFSKLLFKQSF